MIYLQHLKAFKIYKNSLIKIIQYNPYIFIIMNFKKLLNIFFLLFLSLLITSCSRDFFKFTSAKDSPVKGIDRAKKNVEEGRGVKLGGLVGGGNRSTTYEFSTSNPLWRASLDTLDFIPMTTVDYSGGTIVSDWYNDGSQKNESIKITLRFLSNEIRSDSLKIVVHKKTCSVNQICEVDLINNSILVSELQSTILKKAVSIEKEQRANKAKKNKR